MLTTIAVAIVIVAVLLVAVLGYAATRPDTFVVKRTTAIKAPPDKVFGFINDFRQWGHWSPWENKDPAMTRSFSGSSSGIGAIYAWDGNRNVGAGRMEITDTQPSSKIAIKLDFIKPFEGHHIAEFAFMPSGDTTIVTWAMRGPLPYIAKVFHLFFDMDRIWQNRSLRPANNLMSPRVTEMISAPD
jgi:hypothetical protein